MNVLPYQSPGSIPQGLAAVVQAELRAGETLLWAGRPGRRGYALRAVPVCFVAAFLIAFGVFWRGQTSKFLQDFGALPAETSPVFGWFPMIGVVIASAGGLLMLAPLWLAWRAGRTCYAVTNRRAIVLRRGPLGGGSVESYGGPELNRMTRRQLFGRRGDLIFEEQLISNAQGVCRRRRGFLFVDGAAEVEDLIRRTLL
jgi:hypothetical protein